MYSKVYIYTYVVYYDIYIIDTYLYFTTNPHAFNISVHVVFHQKSKRIYKKKPPTPKEAGLGLGASQVQAFRWSLTLISKMLIRVITEGVMLFLLCFLQCVELLFVSG